MQVFHHLWCLGPGFLAGVDVEVERMTPLEEARETESSTEVGEQSISCRRHDENLGDSRIGPKFLTKKLLEVLSLKRARLEEPLEDEQEKIGEDETEQIGPENTFMTKI